MRQLILFLLLVGMAPLWCAQVTWDDYLALLKEDHAERPHLLYLGSPENRMAQMLTGGKVDTKGLDYTIIDVGGAYRNPMTGRMVPGRVLYDLYAATAGTLLWLDGSGIPIQSLRLTQFFHGNDTELVSVYSQFSQDGYYQAMSLRDFCTAIGADAVFTRLNRRTSTDGLAVPFQRDRRFPMAVLDSGEPVVISDSTGVFFVAGDPAGRAFRAQVQEIAIGFRAVSPRITLLVPPGSDVSFFNDQPYQVSVLRIGKQWLETGPTPRLLLFGEDGGGIEVNGFQPVRVLGQILGIESTGVVAGTAGIPMSETDSGRIDR